MNTPELRHTRKNYIGFIFQYFLYYGSRKFVSHEFVLQVTQLRLVNCFDLTLEAMLFCLELHLQSLAWQNLCWYEYVPSRGAGLWSDNNLQERVGSDQRNWLVHLEFMTETSASELIRFSDPTVLGTKSTQV